MEQVARHVVRQLTVAIIQAREPPKMSGTEEEKASRCFVSLCRHDTSTHSVVGFSDFRALGWDINCLCISCDCQPSFLDIYHGPLCGIRVVSIALLNDPF